MVTLSCVLLLTSEKANVQTPAGRGRGLWENEQGALAKDERRMRAQVMRRRWEPAHPTPGVLTLCGEWARACEVSREDEDLDVT